VSHGKEAVGRLTWANGTPERSKAHTDLIYAVGLFYNIIFFAFIIIYSTS
jgi:hypothetical protein